MKLLALLVISVIIFKTDTVKLINVNKKYCRDLRDCQTYFPCEFFVNNYINPSAVQHCWDDFIFDEDKQQCTQPIKKEDFDCLLNSKLSGGSKLRTTTTTSTTSTTKITPKVRLSTRKPQTFLKESRVKSSENLKLSPIEINSQYQEATTDIYKRICVVTNWSQYRVGKAKFSFSKIDTDLCNFILFSSIEVLELDDEYKLQPLQQNDLELYAQLRSFKTSNPSLKTLLRITDDNGRIFSKLCMDKSSRANFIKNTISFIEQNDFDGIDIDWQDPSNANGSPHDKDNLITLLKEFKESAKGEFLISVSIPPFIQKLRSSYDLKELNNVVNYVNLEAFDYYGPWDRKVGISAPLSKMDDQLSNDAFLNIEGTVAFLKAFGIVPHRIVLGVSAYARSFILEDKSKTSLNSLSTGQGFTGTYTKINGLLAYYELCELRNNAAWKTEWVEKANAPFMHNSDGEWVSFENEESLKKKMKFVKDNHLGGVSINSIDFDDFDGSFCNNGPYPFLKATLSQLVEQNVNLTNMIQPQVTQPRVDLTKRSSTSPLVILITPPEQQQQQQQQQIQHQQVVDNSQKQYTIEEVMKMKQMWMNNDAGFNTQNQMPVVSAPVAPPQPQQFPQYQNQYQQNQNQNQNQYQNSAGTTRHPREQEFLQRLQFETQQKEQPQPQQHKQQQQQQQQNSQVQHELWLKQLQNHQAEIQRNLDMQNQLQHLQDYSTRTVNLAYPTYTQQPQQPQQPQISQQAQHQKTLIDNIKCIGKANGIYRDEFDCTAFYVCEALEQNPPRYHKFTCPDGLVFNMQECTCDWPNILRPCVVPLMNSFCKAIENVPQQRQMNQQYQVQSAPALVESVFSCYGKQNGLHRDYYDCTKFYYCQIITSSSNQYPIVTKHDFVCPSDLQFDIQKCRCDWPTSNTCLTAAYFGMNTYCLPAK